MIERFHQSELFCSDFSFISKCLFSLFRFSVFWLTHKRHTNKVIFYPFKHHHVADARKTKRILWTQTFNARKGREEKYLRMFVRRFSTIMFDDFTFSTRIKAIFCSHSVSVFIFTYRIRVKRSSLCSYSNFFLFFLSA